MMPDREKTISKIKEEIRLGEHWDEAYRMIDLQLLIDALSLLKEQDTKERKWLQAIADNQIANAPKDSPMSLDEQLECEYKSGIYDGLQMAFEILMEGR